MCYRPGNARKGARRLPPTLARMKTSLYVSFPGNAREALEFYHGVFGGELKILTYGEQLDQGAQFPFDPPRDAIAHGTLTGPFTIGGGDDLQNQKDPSIVASLVSPPKWSRWKKASISSNASPQAAARSLCPSRRRPGARTSGCSRINSGSRGTSVPEAVPANSPFGATPLSGTCARSPRR